MVAQDQRDFLEWQPASHDQGHTVMLMCLRNVEETLVHVTRPHVGGSVSSSNVNDECLPHGLGSGHEWLLYPGSVGRSLSHVAHQLPGDAVRVSSIGAIRPERL